ncbi:hypothetical protein FB451DRAFT_1414463 [Mycena latifolia]|nr:hypothetical protein FB451DRAFT_1414463 [Mycena latifolia]
MKETTTPDSRRAQVSAEAGVTLMLALSAEVISIVMRMLGPMVLTELSKTCRAFGNAYKAHMLSTTYQMLHRFGLPPRTFLKAMLSTASVIAGSTAANILVGGRFEPEDLDVFTPSSECNSMRTILQENLGFRLSEETLPDGMQGTLRMLYVYEKQGRTVNLWIASGENPTVPIMLTTSTFMMNFISPWGIYCAYPHLTLKKRGIINHFTDNEYSTREPTTYRRVIDSIDKSTKRGISFEVDDRNWSDVTAGHRCYTSPTCTHTIRTLYDKAGLFIFTHTTIWSLGGDYCNDPVLYHRAFSQSKKLYVRTPIGDDEDEEIEPTDSDE